MDADRIYLTKVISLFGISRSTNDWARIEIFYSLIPHRDLISIYRYKYLCCPTAISSREIFKLYIAPRRNLIKYGYSYGRQPSAAHSNFYQHSACCEHTWASVYEVGDSSREPVKEVDLGSAVWRSGVIDDPLAEEWGRPVLWLRTRHIVWS